MPIKQVIKKNALVPTILISGGAGFIGSHLAEFLLDKKARVIVIDNFKTGKEIHVSHLVSNKDFALFDVDINKGIPEDIESVDYIFHLAGLEEYLLTKDFVSLDSLLTNSLGTKNLLDLAERSNAKFLLASTIDVYQGRISQLYLDKYFGKTEPEENKFSLIEAKRFAEAIVWEYFNSKDVDARIVRLPEVYGPRMNLESSGSLGGFLQEVMDRNPLSVYGEGTEKEYYLHVSDVASGLAKALFNKNTKGNIYSLVPNEPLTVLEIAYFIKGLADGKLAVEFKPVEERTRSPLRSPDTFNIKGLGWKPKIDFKQGVVDTLASLGYSINTHAFKPSKLVEQKAREVSMSKKEALVSLQDLVPRHIPEPNTKPKIRFKKVIVEKPYSAIKDTSNISVIEFLKKKTKIFENVGLKFRSFHLGLRTDVGYGLSIMAVFIAATSVFVGIPGLGLHYNATRGVNQLQSIKDNALEFDLEEIEKQTLVSYKSFSKARNSLHRLKWIFKITKKVEMYTSYDRLLGSLTNFSKSVYQTSSAVKPLGGSLWEILRPDTTGVLNVEAVKKAELGVSSAKSSLKLAEADLLGINKEALSGKVSENISLYEGYLYKLQEGLDLATVVFSDLPGILGLGGEKKYIIWFQNSNEIRPTGGFIGSYGVLSLENGKLKNLVIDDIYNPDGQIDQRNIVVTPPDPIKTFLEEDRLYLRNSNWDPDFTRSVSAFDDLYFRITGEEIDGYIAIDLSFVESLLDVTGPVFLAAYNEEISSQNLDERAQFYSSFDYEEGVSEKRSFLTVLGSKLLERLFSLQKENLGSLFSVVNESLNQRHLMVFLENSPINVILKQKRWDGSLVEASRDYLSVVNANLGGTKANYHVKNKLTYEVNSLTRDGVLRANLYLDYEHTAESDAWPSGPYTNYVRILTQRGAKLTGARVIDESGVESDIFGDIVVENIGNYNSFGTSFTLNPSSSIRLVFSYDLPIELSFSKEEQKYSLYWQKQPGTHDDDFFFIFNPPFGSEIESMSSNLQKEQDSIKSSGIFSIDESFFLLLR